MDRQEYREIIGEIKAGYKNKDYERVIMFAKEIPLKKIKENSVIEMIASSYDQVGKPALARTTLETAYKRMPGGKQTAYRLSMLALKTKDIEAAVGYYEDFCRIAPNDNQRFILKYEIAKEGGLSIYDKIRILEEYTAKETDDKWMYELARLYHEAGMGDQCADMCDDIVVWFSDGDYLKRALELKFAHKALTPTQQAMYEKIMQDYIEDYEEPEPEEEEPSPLDDVEAEEFANDFLENTKSQFDDTRPVDIPESMSDDHDEESELINNKKLSFDAENTKPEQEKNIFYDFRLEDAALDPDPELNKWLASLPDIKDVNKKTGDDNIAEKEVSTSEKVFADIPVAEDETENKIDPVVEGSDAVLENLEIDDEKRMVEASKIFNEPIAEETHKKEDFDEELKKLYSSALDSIRETPILNPEFDKKKVEFSEGQLDINLDLLNHEDSEVEGQLSIDQLFQTYANNIENNLENKAAVAKVEAERLKQIREAVEQSMPRTPIEDLYEEEPQEEPEEVETGGINNDPDMDEQDRWNEDPVDKLLNDFVAETPAKEEIEENIIVTPEPEPAEKILQKDIEIPEFLRNLQFEDVEDDVTEEEALELLAEEDDRDEEIVEDTEEASGLEAEEGLFYEDEAEGEEAASFEDEEAESFEAEEPGDRLETHVKTEEEIEEELDDMSDFLEDFMKEEEQTDMQIEEAAEDHAPEAAVIELMHEETSDDELDEIGNTLADIFGDDETAEETEDVEIVLEETEDSEEETAGTDTVSEEEPEEAEGVSEDEDEETEIAEAILEEEPETVEKASEEETEEAEDPEIVEEALEEVEIVEEISEEEQEEIEEISGAEPEEEKLEESDNISEPVKTVEEENEIEYPDEEDELFDEIFNEINEERSEIKDEADEQENISEEAETAEADEIEEATAEQPDDNIEKSDEEFSLEDIIDEAASEAENESKDESTDGENEIVDPELETDDVVPEEDAESEETSEEGIESEEPSDDVESEETPEEGVESEEEAEEEVESEEASEENEENPDVADDETADAKEVTGDTQEIEKIYKFSLDEESREEIAEFLLISGMGEKITNTVENIILTQKSGDVTGGNLMITGDAKTGKTFLAISMIKAVNKELKSGSGKVAKVQSESLNGKDIEKVFLKIAGNDLIIENVGDLDDKTIDDILDVMKNGNSQNMVVFEGNMLALETMINKHPEIEQLFKNRVDISELSITQWADIACDYAKRKGYKVGDMALLALHAKIDEINLPTSRFGYEDVVNIMEAAIEKCEKRNTGKLFSAFSRKEDDAIELSESDFV